MFNVLFNFTHKQTHTHTYTHNDWMIKLLKLNVNFENNREKANFSSEKITKLHKQNQTFF